MSARPRTVDSLKEEFAKRVRAGDDVKMASDWFKAEARFLSRSENIEALVYVEGFYFGRLTKIQEETREVREGR